MEMDETRDSGREPLPEVLESTFDYTTNPGLFIISLLNRFDISRLR